jgi:hypothetical protein
LVACVAQINFNDGDLGSGLATFARSSAVLIGGLQSPSRRLFAHATGSAIKVFRRGLLRLMRACQASFNGRAQASALRVTECATIGCWFDITRPVRTFQRRGHVRVQPAL